MQIRGDCTNKSIMCQSASIVSRTFCRGCRHVARKAVQPPTTRSVAARNNKARGAAKGMSKHNPKAFQKPVQHVPRPSKIKVPEFLGRQNLPRRRPRQGKGGPRPTTKDPISCHPRAAQEGPRAVQERPKASQTRPNFAGLKPRVCCLGLSLIHI